VIIEDTEHQQLRTLDIASGNLHASEYVTHISIAGLIPRGGEARRENHVRNNKGIKYNLLGFWARKGQQHLGRVILATAKRGKRPCRGAATDN